jgi:hypothetical protein
VIRVYDAAGNVIETHGTLASSKNHNEILFAGFGRGESGLYQKHQVDLVRPTPAPEICSGKFN